MPATLTHSPDPDLWPLLYNELRSLASQMLKDERANPALQTTELVHAAYTRLCAADPTRWAGEAHFRAAAAKTMRRVLIDESRRRRTLKRGGEWRKVCLHGLVDGRTGRAIDYLEFEDALQALEAESGRPAAIVELRFLGGMGVSQVAAFLGISDRQVESDTQFARLWLHKRISGVPR